MKVASYYRHVVKRTWHDFSKFIPEHIRNEAAMVVAAFSVSWLLGNRSFLGVLLYGLAIIAASCVCLFLWHLIKAPAQLYSESKSLESDRPRLVLAVVLTREEKGSFSDNWLKLRNFGPGPAFDIRIQEIRNGSMCSLFEPLYVLGVGETRDVAVQTREPTGEGNKYWYTYRIQNFVEMFLHGVADAKVISRPAIIRFQDQHQRQHEIIEIITCEATPGMLFIASKDSIK